MENEKFFDVRTHQPQPGQILARFVTYADLLEGSYKSDIYEILCHSNDGAKLANQIMREQVYASNEYSVLVPLEIAQDIRSGMSKKEIMEKPYRFIYERFFYTTEDDVPKDDKYWQVIKLIDCREDERFKKENTEELNF